MLTRLTKHRGERTRGNRGIQIRVVRLAPGGVGCALIDQGHDRQSGTQGRGHGRTVGVATGQIDEQDAGRLRKSGEPRFGEWSRLEIVREILEERGRRGAGHMPDDVAGHQRSISDDRPGIL